MTKEYVCLHCNKKFNHRKPDKKYCSNKCYRDAKKLAQPEVTLTCVICSIEFNRPWRWRTQKTCGKECFKKLASQLSSQEKVEKYCSICNKKMLLNQSQGLIRKFCSEDCFHTFLRNGEKFTVDLTCEACGKIFTKRYINRDRRFCSKKCSSTGEHNGMFGKPGNFKGKQSWNHGLTAKTDTRLFELGRKISEVQKEQFREGIRSNAGEKNPNFGRTPETRSEESKVRYSKAAAKRILDGVAGYGTCNKHGSYTSSKTSKTMLFRSSWEELVMLYLDNEDTVLDYRYEPFSIEIDSSHRYVPDFLIQYIDRTVIVEVKPKEFIFSESVVQKSNAAEKFASEHGFEYEIWSNEKIESIRYEIYND
jgi:endogenous inhibitor of DNA gyrase (YacG/DUF329 family)